MLHLYIARHGQTQWNVEKRMQRWQDSDLTELGQYNARALGERLKDFELNQIYISPSKRTEETAKPTEIAQAPSYIQRNVIGLMEREKTRGY